MLCVVDVDAVVAVVVAVAFVVMVAMISKSKGKRKNLEGENSPKKFQAIKTLLKLEILEKSILVKANL